MKNFISSVNLKPLKNNTLKINISYVLLRKLLSASTHVRALDIETQFNVFYFIINLFKWMKKQFSMYT